MVALLPARFRLIEFRRRRRLDRARSLRCPFYLRLNRFRTPVGNAAGLLLRLGIGFADPLPQAFQRVGAGLWAESIIGAESLHDGLDHFFLNIVRTGFPFPVIEHFGEPTDDGTIAVPVLMFETEKFS